MLLAANYNFDMPGEMERYMRDLLASNNGVVPQAAPEGSMEQALQNQNRWQGLSLQERYPGSVVVDDNGSGNHYLMIPASGENGAQFIYLNDNGTQDLRRSSHYDFFTDTLGPAMSLAAIGGAGAAAAGAGGGAAAGGGSAAAGGTTAGASEGVAAAGGEELGGPGMWDWLDDVGIDEYGNTGGNFTGGSGDFYSLGSPADVDAMAGGSGGFDAGMGDYLGMGNPSDAAAVGQIAASGGLPSPSLWSKLGDAALIQKLLGGGSRAISGAVGGTRPDGGGIGGMSLGDMAFNSAPFLLAAYMANQQRNDINPYISRLNSLNDRFAGNESPYIKSLTDPYDMSTARGRGDLTMSLGQRGVMGSSFGNNDLDNFGYLRDVGRGNLVANAVNQSVGAQSQLTDQAIKGVNVRNANTNALLGAGLNASARLFSPQRDPFGLSEILKLAGNG